MKKLDWRLVAILGLGLGLRCVNIATRSIQYDDAFSFFLARRDIQLIILGTAADTMPPLYYFLLHLWMQISTEIGWLRLLSVLLDLAAVLSLFYIVKQISGKSAGLWAAFFAAISPLQIYHSQDLRMYALLAAMQLGYLFFFYQWWSVNQLAWRDRYRWIALVICGTAAMYTHNLAIFVLVVPDFYLLFKRQWKALLRLLLVQAVIGLLTLPWIILIPGQVEKIQRAFWTPQPGLVEIFQAIIMMTTNLPLDGIWLVVGAVISVQILAIIGWEIIKHPSPEFDFLLIACLIPPVLLFAISYIMRPVFVPRGFLTSTLIYLGLAGVVTARALKKPIKWVIVIGLFIAAAIALPYQLSFEQFPRSPYNQTMQAIRQMIQPGERIVHDNKLSYFPSYYYAPDLDQHFIADEPGSPNDTYALASQKSIGLIPEGTLEGAVGDADTVYYVVFEKTIEEYKSLGLSNHPHLIWLQNQFINQSSQEYGDLWLFRFSRAP